LHTGTAPLVLVAAPSDEEPCSTQECSQLVQDLRANEIRAEWMHPFGAGQANATVLVGYCRDNGIALFVNKRKGGALRVRGAFDTSMAKDFAKFDQLVTYIRSRFADVSS
jgi:hypothetical protein